MYFTIYQNDIVGERPMRQSAHDSELNFKKKTLFGFSINSLLAVVKKAF